LGVIPRGLIEDGAKAGDGEIPGCLTIASEGRETWAASSLRGVFAWALAFKAFSIEALLRGLALAFALSGTPEEMTDGHVSRAIALSFELFRGGFAP
jgi:hypothetical protein